MLVAIDTYSYYNNKSGPIWFGVCTAEDGKDIILRVQDPLLAPNFYILETDKALALQVWEEKNLSPLITKIEGEVLCTAVGERLIKVWTTFPSEVKKLRDGIDGLLTFKADVCWEKKVVQEQGWKEFLEIKDYDPTRFTPLNAISPTDRRFVVKHNFGYWDIETDSHGVRKFSDWRNAAKMEIINYSIYSDRTGKFVWYGWKKEWKCETLTGTYDSVVPNTARFRTKFKDYPLRFPLTIKRFSNEKDMHKQFIDDVALGHFHGIMVFNGRGGVRIIRKHRKWFDGFDSQMFYERCIHLGLEEYIQRMSPVPYEKKGSYLMQRSVRAFDEFEEGEQTKHEITIKCLPIHDLYYDDNILMYTKEEYDMKRKNLDTYMSHFLECGKVKHKGSSVAELYAKDWEKEMRYNLTDVEGMVALNLNLHYMEDIMGRALLYGCKPEDGVYASKIHDHINLMFTAKQYVMDTRDNERAGNWNGLIETKEGGFNLEPNRGVYGYDKKCYMFMLDFSKLYPSCGMTANADTRTKINLKGLKIDRRGLYLVDNSGMEFAWSECARSPAGFFRKDIISLNTQIYSELIGARKKLQKEASKYKELASNEPDPVKKAYYWSYYSLYNAAQFSYKGLINGKFGADGMEGTRTYDKVVYNTPPTMGQEIIQHVIYSVLPSLNYTVENKHVLFSSTDSVLCVCFTEGTVQDAIDEAEKVTEKVNTAVEAYVVKEFNPIKSYIKMDCEKIADVGVIFDMRRYMLNIVAEEKEDGWIIHKEPRPFWKGIEKVRKDTAMITNDVQTDLLNMIRLHKDKEVIFEYIRKLDDEYIKKPWEYICGRATTSNNSESVEIDNSHYRAIENANRLFNKGYAPGDAPMLGEFIRKPTHMGDEPISVSEDLIMAFEEEDEFPLKKMGFDLNYEVLKKKHVIDKIEPILKILGLPSYKTIVEMSVGSAIEV